MQSLKKIVQVAPKLIPVAPKLVPQARQASNLITGPPTNPLGMGEKLVHGTIIVVSCLAFPVYVLVNLKNYQIHEEN